MNTTRFSEVVQEAFATAKNNNPLIETIEVYHPALVIKKSLEICFVVDRWAASTTYSDIVARFIAQIDEIKSELADVYKSIKWSFVTVTGEEWTFETGSNFTTFANFREKVLALTTVVSTSKSEIYAPLQAVVANLNWSPSRSSLVKHVVFVGDTGNLTTSTNEVEINFTGHFQFSREVMPGSALRRLIGYFRPTGAEPRINLYTLGWQNIGQTVSLAGIPDVMVGLDIDKETSYYNRSYRIGLDPRYTSPSNAQKGWYILNEFDDSPIVPDGIGLDSYTGNAWEGVTLTGSHLVTTTSSGDPAATIAALGEEGIIFNQFPTFTNADLTSIITATGGTSLTTAQLSNETLVKDNLFAILTNEETVVSSDERLYLVREMVAMDLTLETSEIKTFQPCGFKLELPEKSDTGLQDLNIAIDNTDGIVTDFLERALEVQNQSIQIIYRPYLASDLTQPQMNPPLVLYMTNASSKGSEVVGTASFSDVLNKTFLSQKYTLERFPALK